MFIRIFYRQTVDFCQKAEHAGVSWITVHGRTKEQRAHPVNYDAIRLIKESVTLPVIANGDIRSVEEARTVCDMTGVNGGFITLKWPNTVV